jgi:hypothetical protein
METTSLFFDAECRMLGELSTTNGALVRAVLTDDGEEKIGTALRLWQTEGVPFLRRMEGVHVQEHISVRDERFLESVCQWASVMQMQCVSVTSEVLSCWQQIAHLPLEPFQRYSMLLALCSLDEKELSIWKQSLNAATEAVMHEREKAAKDIQVMWTEIAKTLVDPQKRKKT